MITEHDNIFSVETKVGQLKSIPFRTRWILKSNKSQTKFPMGDAEGHAECRGKMACGHIDCRGKYACGNPTKSGITGIQSVKDIISQLNDGQYDIPNKSASVFEILEAKTSIKTAII